MPLFSIIIPIYKVEKYLVNCIESVLFQSYGNFELILIDDGSPDSCPQICDEYKKKDCRIKVIHKKNEGLSAARNAGLKNADGDYILFIDSDDFLSNNDALKLLSERITAFNEDLIVYGFNTIYEDGKINITRPLANLNIINKKNKIETINHLVSTSAMPAASWVLCARLELIRKIHLEFKPGITGEDYDWIMQLFYYCKSIGSIDQRLYSYLRRSNSITTSAAKISGVRGISYAINRWLQLRNRPHSLDLYMCKVYFIMLLNYANLKKEERLLVFEQIVKDSIILKESNKKILYLIVDLFRPYIIGSFLSMTYIFIEFLRNNFSRNKK